MRLPISPVAALAALLLAGAGCPAKNAPVASQPAPTQVAPAEATTAPVPETQPTAKVFALTARQWRFEPAEIRVKQGEKVRLTVTSVDVTHGFALPDFNVNLNLEPGKTVGAEFTAEKKGTFTFFCNVYCGQGHREMSGMLIVE